MAGSVCASPEVHQRKSVFRRWAGREARAAWGGRFRWGWLLIALGVEAWLCLTPDLHMFEPPFSTLCKLAAWVPAWLCADLLALGFRSNREPLREWPPAEFLARALGRLGPFWAVMAVWAGTYAARAVAKAVAEKDAGILGGSGGADAGLVAATWLAWTGVFLASGLPYAALAALGSATARRPRTWVIGPLAISLGMLLEHLFLTRAMEPGGFLSLTTPAGAPLGEFGAQVLQYAPNLFLGYVSAGMLGQALRLSEEIGWMAWVCGLASLAFLGYSLPPFLVLWWVTARRFRRAVHAPITPQSQAS